MSKLLVVSFDEPLCQDQGFRSMLCHLRLDCELISGDNFLKASTINSPEESAFLFVINPDQLTRPAIHRAINDHFNKHGKQINLCLLTDIESQLPKELYLEFHDFLFWPCCAAEINARLDRFAMSAIGNSGEILDRQLLHQFSHFNLVGRSRIFVQTLGLIKKMACCSAPVLIRGETGTGKENAARAIHYLSDRADFGFVPINCGALPDELLESELFGYERGAFTDAKTSQPGLVKIADGGTVFLDEVDSLSAKAQGALLRFLQTHEYRPLGARTTCHADVRVLAATNADLTEQVANGNFRIDLLFRLNVLLVDMPPLRQRAGDIPDIAESLLHKFSREHSLPPKRLSPSSLLWLMQQSWPGNVRELENVILRHFLLSDLPVLNIVEDLGAPETNESITDVEIPTHFDSGQSYQEAKSDAIRQFEKGYLRNLLFRSGGNVSEAARVSGKERRALGKLLKKYRIDKNDYQGSSSEHRGTC